MTAREFWHINSNESIIREKKYDLHEEGKLLIKSIYSMISTGTERVIAMGMVPADMQLHMKVPYMDGYLGLPVKYGYSLVGEIIEGPVECRGKMVHLMHPHQNFAWVDSRDVTYVPEGIPLLRATLASNMETALNTVWESGISAGDNVLVCGFGIIGALVSLLASQIPGVRVCVHETEPDRKEVAEKFGFGEADPPRGFDIAINTTGSEEALQLCIDRTLHGGTITELSWYGTHKVSLSLGSSFHIGQKKIISSQASVIPLERAHRCDKKRRKHIVFDLLKNSVYDKLPFHIIPFETLPEVFRQIRAASYKPLCSVVKY